MKKKGNLLTNEVLKMVVAVICIGFLVYFISALYFSNSNSRKTIEASSLMEKIDGEILNMEQNSLTSFQVTDLSPVGWWMFSFITPEQKPNSCSGENCLCVCKKTISVFGDGFGKQLIRCGEDGACLIVENLKGFSGFKLGNEEGSFTSIKIESVSGMLEVKRI